MVETSGITTNFDEWVAAIERGYENIGHDYCAMFDKESARALLPYFAGLMTSPVAVVGDETIMAKSFAASQWSDFEFLKAHRGDVYLYDLRFEPSVPRHFAPDPVTFQPVKLNRPEMTKAKWVIRYAEREKSGD